MTTTEFEFIAGDVSLDFVNTLGNRLAAPNEHLRTPADVTQWARLAGLLDSRQSLRTSPRGLGTIRTTRELLYRIFRAIALGGRPSPENVAELDGMFARVAPKHRLVSRRGILDWEWHAPAHDPARILGPVLASACALLVSPASELIRECQGEGCGWLFLDRSHASARRWCSMRDCGNRAKARRHYAVATSRAKSAR